MVQLNPTVTDQTLVQVTTPFAVAPVTTQSAPDAFTQTVSYAGNSWWSREAIDARIVSNALTNTGPPNGVAAAAPNAAELKCSPLVYTGNFARATAGIQTTTACPTLGKCARIEPKFGDGFQAGF